MTEFKTILAQIAGEHLNIPTLKIQKSDSLDFHTVAVWSVEAALKAAWKAGACQAMPTLEATTTRFDDYEIEPCRRFAEDRDPARFYYEPCDPDEADVWTLYGHIPGQGVEAIGDFATRELAEEIYSRITGRPFPR